MMVTMNMIWKFLDLKISAKVTRREFFIHRKKIFCRFLRNVSIFSSFQEPNWKWQQKVWEKESFIEIFFFCQKEKLKWTKRKIEWREKEKEKELKTWLKNLLTSLFFDCCFLVGDDVAAVVVASWMLNFLFLFFLWFKKQSCTCTSLFASTCAICTYRTG